MTRVRVHQHVNPLSPRFQEVSEPLEFNKIFTDLSLPLHLDIGSARGRFLLKMAQMFPDKNFLGLEIREPLVIEANRLAKEKNLTNLHYEFTNATISLGNLMKNLPASILKTISIQFPDPWFKKKHAKRRMVKDEMASTIVEILEPNGEIFIQTDIEFLAAEMFKIFSQFENLKEIEITENPLAVKTEREIAVEEKNLPVYRRIYTKK